MPGLLPESIANYLTRQSGLMVDWSRVGEFVVKNTMPNYSAKQIKDRALILSWMAGAIVLTEYLRRSVVGEGGFASMTLSIVAGSIFGGYYGHKYVLADKFKSREENHKEIVALNEIITTLCNGFSNEDGAKIQSLLANIHLYEYKEEGEVKLGATLLKKKQALKTLKKKIESENIEGILSSSLHESLTELGLKYEENEGEVSHSIDELRSNAFAI